MVYVFTLNKQTNKRMKERSELFHMTEYTLMNFNEYNIRIRLFGLYVCYFHAMHSRKTIFIRYVSNFVF